MKKEKEYFYKQVYLAAQEVCELDFRCRYDLRWRDDVLHVTIYKDIVVSPLVFKEHIYYWIDHVFDPCDVCNYYAFDVKTTTVIHE